MTLWLRFAEDSSLPAVMDDAARGKFEALFDTSDPASPFRRSLQLLGLTSAKPDTAMIFWHGNAPYINWGFMVGLLTGSIVSVQKAPDGGIAYTTSYRLAKLPGFIAAQWKISSYILTRLEADYVPPQDDAGRIAESLALGFALLALTMRLPAHTQEQLAAWLANPAQVPPRLRKTLQQMQRIQCLRTVLSSSWTAWFPSTGEDAPITGPEHFWNQPPAEEKPTIPSTIAITQWKGLGVCGNAVTGRAVFMTRSITRDMLQSLRGDPLILIFPLARPESVEWYEYATGLLFGDGGLMSHACTIAREQNLPCITALGKSFTARLREDASNAAIWIRLDPLTGMAKYLQ